MKRQWILVLVLLPLVSASALAQPLDPFSLDPGRGPAPMAAEHIALRALSSDRQVKPGQSFHVALEMTVAKGWIFYSPDAGGLVMSARLAVDAGSLTVGEILWPQDVPKTDPILKQTLNVYTGRFFVYVRLTVPADQAQGKVRIELTPEGQICEKVCLPVQKMSADVTVIVGDRAEANPAWSSPSGPGAGLAEAMPASRLKDARSRPAPAAAAPDGPDAAPMSLYTLVMGFGLALLAGLTLNIMPCVLPIIPVRILSIVQLAGDTRRRYVTLGLAFAGGIVAFFVALAAVNVVLWAVGQATFDINEHFKYPAVRIGLALVLLALAANLFGVFTVTVPSKLAGVGQQATGQGHLFSAGMGFMMAVLSTPCSFAVMAGALSIAQTQPLWFGTATIVLIGVGMAVPHAVLCAFPGLVNRLPRPGRWMELFKQAMGFLLLPAVVYLLRTLSTGEAWPFWVAGFCVAVVFGLWMWGSWVGYGTPPLRKWLVRGAAVALVGASGLWMLPKPAEPQLHFEPFEMSRIDRERRQGRVVLVKFTASWCTECHILDYKVYDTPEVADDLNGRGVVALEADVTDSDGAAAKFLYGTLHGAPPLTLIYPPGKDAEPIRLVGEFSRADLIRALDKAAGQ